MIIIINEKSVHFVGSYYI